MAMEAMVPRSFRPSSKKIQAAFRVNHCGQFFLWAGIILLLAMSPTVEAVQDWKFEPEILVGEIFTNNAGLDVKGEEKGDFVTEVTPSIHIFREGGRFRLDFDYSLQGLLYGKNPDLNDINHQFNLASTVEAVKQSIFVDAHATLGKNSPDPISRIAQDNITDAGNTSTILTYGISPYWRVHQGTITQGEVRLATNHTISDREGLSDSDQVQFTVNLVNGRSFSRFTWSVNFNHDQDIRASADDVRFQDSLVSLRYQVLSELSVFALGGHTNDSFASASDPDALSGTFSSYGLIWEPSRFLTMRAGKGNNREDAGITFTPNQRTYLDAQYVNLDIGRDRGENWSVTLSHRTRHTVSRVTYSEDATTTQILLGDIPFTFSSNADLLDQLEGFIDSGLADESDSFLLVNFPDPASGTLGRAILPGADLNEVFRRERLNLSWTGRYGRSVYVLSAFEEDRIFEVSLNEEQLRGHRVSWAWDMSRRHKWVLSNGRGFFQQVDRISDRITSEISLQRTLTRDSNVTASIAHTTQDGSGTATNFVEDRISIYYNLKL